MKVLMTLMGLDIGGAETHVLELSRALVDLGVEITVASNGGAYVPELEKSGIRHVSLPLHSKNPIAVLKSYFGLKRLIKKEKFEIVHAHARIPAFICGVLHKKLKFRFVCSAHWVFKVNFIWRKLADWGEKTIAVSEDIKQYVIDNYGVFADNISVTINGVDMKKFSPDTECDSVAKEFCLPENRKTLVYVSRLDKDRSEAAHILLKIAPYLKEKFKNLQIVIVGAGDDFDRINELSSKVNSKENEPFIHLAGSRTDINRFIALGDIFIGVSRAALEAMSASKPVILAGNEGYIGFFDKDKLDTAVATNFCCRGCAKTSETNLLSDLEKLLSMSEDELSASGSYNRSLIKSNYSSSKMANDCLEVYRSLTPYYYKKHSDIIISGYYGFGNVGDDSLLLSIVKSLREINPDIRITALTRKPKKATRKYGVKCVNRFNLFAVSREMKHAKLLISGGGSLLQNNTSTKSLEYYILIMKMAKKQGLHVMVYANGIGPLYGDYSQSKVKNILEKVDLVSLREPSSYEFLKSIGVKVDEKTPNGNDKIQLSVDPAISIFPADNKRTSYILEKNGIDVKSRKYFAVSLRQWDNLRTFDGKTKSSDFENEIALAISEIYKKFGVTPVFLPVQKSFDEEICRKICVKVDKLCHSGQFFLPDLSASELISVLENMEFALGMRLHVLIYATSAKIPAIGLSYDPKVSAFLEYSGQPKALDLNTLTKDVLLSKVELVINERDIICQDIGKHTEKLRLLSKKDAENALSLSNG